MKQYKNPKRATLKHLDDYLLYEPYKSIINLLYQAPNLDSILIKGIPQYIMHYIITEDYTPKRDWPKWKEKRINTLKEQFRKDKSLGVQIDQNLSETRQGFNKFISKLYKVGWIAKKNNGWFLNPQKELFLIKKRQTRIIEEKNITNILARQHSTFYLPSNIQVNDFTCEDIQLLAEMENQLFASLEKILSGIKERKRKKIWKKRIIENDEFPPLLKVYLWIRLLMDNLCAHSTTIFLSLIKKSLPTKRGDIETTKTLSYWHKKEDKLINEIFVSLVNDLKLIRYIHNGRRIFNEDAPLVNIYLENKFNTYWWRLVNIINDEIYIFDRNEGYAFIINPLFHFHSPNKELKKYIVSKSRINPWIKIDSNRDVAPIDILNYIKRSEIEKGWRKEEIKEIETSGIKCKFLFTEIPKSKNNEYRFVDSFSDENIDHFTIFPESIQKKILNFCYEIGYKDKQIIIGRINNFWKIYSFPGEVTSMEDVLNFVNP